MRFIFVRNLATRLMGNARFWPPKEGVLGSYIASRFSLQIAPRRPAPARVDVRRRAAATPRHKDCAAPVSQEPSRNPCPPRFRPRSRPFLGTKTSYSTDLETRKQKSRRTMRLSAITHGQ